MAMLAARLASSSRTALHSPTSGARRTATASSTIRGLDGRPRRRSCVA